MYIINYNVHKTDVFIEVLIDPTAIKQIFNVVRL